LILSKVPPLLFFPAARLSQRYFDLLHPLFLLNLIYIRSPQKLKKVIAYFRVTAATTMMRPQEGVRLSLRLYLRIWEGFVLRTSVRWMCWLCW